MDLTPLQPRTVSLTVQVDDPAYRPTSATVAVELRPPMLVGLSTTVGAPTRQAVADYPGIRYMRDFGVDTADADRWPELPPHNGGKFGDAPDAAMHVSWKDDVEQLTTWLDGVNRPVYLTWWHEPMGDVAPVTYRATAARVSQIVSAHPKKRYVLGHGPIVTRYWLDEDQGDPRVWAYPGMTHYGIDCYSRDTVAYWPASRMFGAAFAKVRTAQPGVRLLVPEYGLTRTAGDATGEGRARAIRDHVAWLRQQADVDAVAYWSNAVVDADYRIAAGTPEAAAWRAAQQQITG